MMSLLLTDNFNQYLVKLNIKQRTKVQSNIIDCDSEKMSFCIMLQSFIE